MKCWVLHCTKQELYFAVALICASGAASFGQQQVIAVQNGSTPKFYTTLPAAMDATKSGDTLYLPAGTFNLSSVIKKELHFVGRGHYPSESAGSGITRIIGNVILQKDADESSFEGLYLDNVFIANGTSNNVFITLDKVTISRCNIGNATLGGTFTDANNPVNNVTNVTISECVVRGNLDAKGAQGILIEKSIFNGHLTGFNSGAIVENSIFLGRPFNSASGIQVYNSIFLFNNTGFLTFENNNIFNQ